MKVSVIVDFEVYEADGKAMAKPGEVSLTVTDATAEAAELVKGSQDTQSVLLECARECIARHVNRPPDFVEGSEKLRKGVANA